MDDARVDDARRRVPRTDVVLAEPCLAAPQRRLPDDRRRVLSD